MSRVKLAVRSVCLALTIAVPLAALSSAGEVGAGARTKAAILVDGLVRLG